MSQILAYWPVAAFLAILSGVSIIMKHIFPAGSAVGNFIQKILDIASGNVQH